MPANIWPASVFYTILQQMSDPLTPPVLNSLCETAYTVSLGLPAHNSDLYFLLLKGGFRYIELYEISRWTDFNDEYYRIETAKGGKFRYFQKISIPEFFLNLLLSHVQFYDFCRYSTFSRTFRRTFVNYPIYCGDKNVTTHIFRYNVCKKLFSDGLTVQEISDYIGEVDNKNTQGYIDSQLFIYS